jgi:transposase
VGIDETSRKKGHKYISTIADLISGKIIYICKGKDSAVLKLFSDFFTKHEGKKENIDLVCCDMSPAFIKGIGEQLPDAAIIFDKFHVMKMVNQAVDEVRREEQKGNRFLKKTRFLWLKNPKNLTERQQKELGPLKDMNLKTVRAYNLKLSFQMFWTIPDSNLAEEYLKKWFFWATHSRLQPFISLAYTIKDHWMGILNYFTNKVTNGLLEGLNSLIQSLKANARGYCNDDNFMTMIYLRHGLLDLNLPI